MSKASTGFAFVAGLTIGAAGAWYYLKDKYAKLAEEEIASVKAAYVLDMVIQSLNFWRTEYLNGIESGIPKDKRWWWQMIQLLPSSYNQRRTVMLNYEVLANIYKSRRHHKLDEWHTLCDRIESLPYSALITGTAV